MAITLCITLSTTLAALTLYSRVRTRLVTPSARPHTEEHVDDEVLRERVARVLRHTAPLVAGVDPQPDALGARPGQALVRHEVPLVVTAQLPRRHRRDAAAEHRLHEVLCAGRGGRGAAHKIGVVGVGDDLVLEDVFVRAPEERPRGVLSRAVCLEGFGDVEPGVAALRVVVVRGHVCRLLKRDAAL
eukprot:2554951-Rhodomonas_salina.1